MPKTDNMYLARAKCVDCRYTLQGYFHHHFTCPVLYSYMYERSPQHSFLWIVLCLSACMCLGVETVITCFNKRTALSAICYIQHQCYIVHSINTRQLLYWGSTCSSIHTWRKRTKCNAHCLKKEYLLTFQPFDLQKIMFLKTFLLWINIFYAFCLFFGVKISSQADNLQK